MKKFLLTLVFSLVLINGYAQQPPIMVCNAAGTTCTPYTNLDTAVLHATSGSYVYIPGGNFSLDFCINKELHLIGAGHYPDSTTVTGISQISTSICFDTGSSNSSLEGLYTGTINLTGATLYNIQVTRCSFYNSTGAMCNTCLFKDDLCRAPTGMYLGCTNCTISNCILYYIGFEYSSIIKNCIIYNEFTGPNNNNTIKNNIFDSCGCSHGSNTCTGCMLIDNLTFYPALYSLVGATLESGTITNVPTGNLFISSNTFGFDYTKDYHLLSTSPGHNAGDDGTDVGIYGSTLPYSPGAVPSNPHFFYQNVNGMTDSTGNLPVHVKVRASN